MHREFTSTGFSKTDCLTDRRQQQQGIELEKSYGPSRYLVLPQKQLTAIDATFSFRLTNRRLVGQSINQASRGNNETTEFFSAYGQAGQRAVGQAGFGLRGANGGVPADSGSIDRKRNQLRRHSRGCVASDDGKSQEQQRIACCRLLAGL